MKRIIAIALVTMFIGGCEYKSPPISDRGLSAVDVWTIGATDDSAMRNAIIRQSTLYPYQFEENSPELNSLGARDLTVLATHFKSYPGKLNVRRGEESADMYKKRVETVVSNLEYAGVPIGKVQIEDLPAGGDGMSTDLVILILKADATGYKKATKGDFKDISSSNDMGSSIETGGSSR